MSHPYSNLPPRAFWRNAVGSINPLETCDIWTPKHELKHDDQVITFGSCFAQHISRALISNNFSWFDGEPGPDVLPADVRKTFNYGVFSARTGNIYTVRALLQWVRWSLGKEAPPEEAWEKDGRFYDPFRPAIEPGGFESPEEMLTSRKVTLSAFRKCLETANVLVFTLGLTESWKNTSSGVTYAACPGTVAGVFDEETHAFHNQEYEEIKSDFLEARDLILGVNPDIRFLLTVSPVPLTATVSDKHIVVATTGSKSILRAVAGHLADRHPDVDYFPSYEIITAPHFRGMFYDPNARTVSHKGVEFVMSHFMGGFGSEVHARPKRPIEPRSVELEMPNDDVKCEEAMLAAFAPRAE